MGKSGSTESVLDDQEIPDKDEDRREQEQQEAPKDVRGAIKAAFKEVEEKSDSEDSERVSSNERNQEQRSIRKIKKDESDADSNKNLQKTDDDSNRSSDRKDDKEEPEDKGGVKKEDTKIDPPPFFKNKGKATWDKLSSEDKQTILAREKEVSDGFAQVSSRLKAVEGLEQVIAPRLQAIQQFGVTPAQTVDRLFQWMEGLTDPRTKANTFKELARSFGVDLNQLVPRQDATTETEETPTTDSPPPWFEEFTNGVQQKIGTLEDTISNQQRAAAQNAVLSWAKDKPHYNKVAPLMGQLLSAGIVGLKSDGSVDLDGAYEKAIKLDPEIAALIQQEAAEKAAKDRSERTVKEAKEKADKVARARKAGVGIKPSAPAGPSVSPNKKLNGDNKNVSVRDSIKASLEELRE